MDLAILWIILTIACWVLFFVLEGFDLGVGMLTPVLGRDEHERGAAARTIAPFWDGNEVWLVAAIGVTFAAFPDWYAALLSGTYLPVVLMLAGLAARGVALEFRNKHDAPKWRRNSDIVHAISALVVAAGFGALIGIIATGLPIGENGEVQETAGALSRSLAPLATPGAIIGALAAVGTSLALGAAFVALRTTGPVRERARRLSIVFTGFLGFAAAAIAVLALIGGAVVAGMLLIVIAVLMFGASGASRAVHEGVGFTLASIGTALAVIAALAVNLPVVLPSTLNDAWSVTIYNGANSDYALEVISIGALFILPGVFLYQAFSYWVLRKRVASERVAS
ncbi:MULTISPECIES: cytochrome d ubiquinol oxidase subunit II [unclassified Diaminobutyricimonas]|uniref:cytochrome d ubiquinol oxidase subunit II n=1 Tax=unclassified Diaminobutyricimonas TaxID=2643261 RepID=UPI0012F4A295|nr:MULTISPECIES: cytochrome d ubiquinol oxidase subunit II [unclassified Diaminobutyricimonas]